MERTQIVVVVVLSAVIGYFFLRTMAGVHSKQAARIISTAVNPPPGDDPSTRSRYSDILTEETGFLDGLLRTFFGSALIVLALVSVVVASFVNINLQTYSVTTVASLSEVNLATLTLLPRLAQA